MTHFIVKCKTLACASDLRKKSSGLFPTEKNLVKLITHKAIKKSFRKNLHVVGLSRPIK